VPHAIIGLQDRYITFANDATEDMFGWKPEELIGQPIAGLIHPDDKDFLMERAKRKQDGENESEA